MRETSTDAIAPRAPRARRVAVAGLILAGCAPPDQPAVAAGALAAALTADSFVPGHDAADAATRALATYLESVREGGRPPATAPAVDGSCGDAAVVHPVEMLAGWQITGRTPRGDTTVVRARTVTVAEENVMGTTPERYMAVQRVRRSEWEWDVIRAGERWLICNGPRFGFVGVDSLTSWRPARASRATARAAADSIHRTRAGDSAP